ncbi:MAG: F0F1 ATP synthase subunit delta [Candidatus Kerfeldbacteria bacterium]|nr:F0F1 ATP synthase subunit delta [Candidatus Kerfeldbacteria bacterium]
MTRRSARQYADALLNLLDGAPPGDHPARIRGFLRELQRRRHLKLLPRILDRIETQRLEATSQVRVRARSARPLPSGFGDRLGRRLKRQVLLETEMDPALVGGIQLRVGERLYDASVPSLLAALRHQLSAHG